MAKAKSSESQEINVDPLTRGKTTLRIIGTTPLFQNRMANKAREVLLLGGRKKTAADRVQLKHDPLSEYRNSAEILPDGPTLIGIRVPAIKGAMCAAAIETRGMTKAGAQRLIFMPGDTVPLYGVPQLRIDVVRSADINRTPDMRTRAFFPTWGAEIDIQFITPQLSQTAVITLLSNAGILIGVGDFRQEKGKGGFGAFRVIGDEQDDDEWDELVATGGRAAQEIAMREPMYANAETAELMSVFAAETKRRSSAPADEAAPKKKRGPKTADAAVAAAANGAANGSGLPAH